MTTTRYLAFLALASAGLAALTITWFSGSPIVSAAAEDPPASAAMAPVACRWLDGEIDLDGRDDEAAWRAAEVIEDFGPYWLGRKALTATRAKLLWNDDGLFFFAEMRDADLYADVTEPDGMAWLNDVFELFFKPDDERLGYYEFQVNAANTPLDMYLPSRGAGGYGRFARAREFHLRSAVALRGTLNDWSDTDDGWSLEGYIPWDDFEPTGGRPAVGARWRFALCRYDYSAAFESPELSTTAPLTKPDFHRYEDYGVLEFVGR